MGNVLGAPPDVESLPQLRHDDHLWMLSCRPCNSARRFAQHSLLFQPDARVFCPHGESCRFLTGPNGEDHRRIFTHTTGDVLRAAVAKDLSENVTEVVNARDVAVKVPYVRQCWSLDSPTADGQVHMPEQLRNRTVIVWVHGFKQTFYPVVNMGDHLLQRLAPDRADPHSPVVAMFLWPGCAKVLEYKKARANAEMAASRLRNLLSILRDQRCNTIVVGHSMGCRVSLQALLQSADSRIADVGHLCSKLVLIAAAVTSNALSPEGEFPLERVAAPEIVVVSSTQDSVLRDHFPTGEDTLGRLVGKSDMPIALGYQGPVEPTPHGVQHMDLSGSLPNHSPHVALTCPRVLQCIRTAAGLADVEAPVSSESDLEDAWSVVSDSFDSFMLSDDQSVSLEDDDELNNVEESQQ